jgi:gluconolactonase
MLCGRWGTLLFASVAVCSLSLIAPALAAELPAADKVDAVKLFEVDNYCEGVVFDSQGHGYLSHGKFLVQFTLDGKNHVWAETGAPNGHRILADGTHLVCDASQHAVLHLSADGKLLPHASSECDGKPLRGPNDLTLDTPNGGFYFSDPGGSSDTEVIGTVHYVDRAGKTHLVDGKLAFPNGIILTPDGKKLYLAESKKNRVLVYDVLSPGKVGERKVLADLPTKDPAKGQIDNQPDGMCLDAAGNIYVAHYGMQQVQVLSPEGKLLRRYPGGNVTTSNVAFGGPDRKQLFVTGGLGAEAGGGGLFRLDLGVLGQNVLPKALAK